MSEALAGDRLAPQEIAVDLVLRAAIDARLRRWRAERFGPRLWDRDGTLWSATPVPELTDRLGWLILPETAPGLVDDLHTFAREVRDEGIAHVVLLGMGGSSLAPEVFAQTYGSAPGHPGLIVLDSTHPDAVQTLSRRIDPARTLVLVSSKSGTTIETSSLCSYFWALLAQTGRPQGRHFVAITDPNAPLVELARERGFRRVFLAPPDVGGRYSALSVFGLVPAALVGVDLGGLLRDAQAMAAACGPAVEPAENPALVLGAVLGEAALAGRDKLTIVTSPMVAALPAWIEQLVAESTGKDGKGIVPVVGEPIGRPDAYGPDRMFVFITDGEDAGSGAAQLAGPLQGAGHPVIRIRLRSPHALGGEFFRWEVATAAVGAVLGIHPFNQPDVQLAKDLAQKAMAAVEGSPDPEGRRAESNGGDRADGLRAMLARARTGEYVAIQAFLAPTARMTARLEELRLAVRDRSRLATTVGYGPRFLHSTGQLHKGGPAGGLFLQLVDQPGADVPVPETRYTFGALIAAQALGDEQALRRRGRRVVRVDLGSDPEGGLTELVRGLKGTQ